MALGGALRRAVVLAGAVCVMFGVLPASPASAADRYRAAEWWLSALHLTQAWQVNEGAGVKIGLIDSGVDATHPDLQGAIAGGTDFTGKGAPNGLKPVGGNDPSFGSDYKGHGTGMAVLMAGRGHGPGHDEGVIGSAPAASVLSISAVTSTTAYAQGHDAIVWAVDHGAKVINMSFGGGVTADDVAYAEAHDVVLVAATGNDGGEGIGQPANLFGVVAVAGIDSDLTGDLTSNYGGPGGGVGIYSHIAEGSGVAVAAPDSRTMPHALLVKDGSYAISAGGTSDSAAIVSGIVALIRAKFPHMDAANVINRLIKTAYRPKGSGVYDAAHGFGVPNAYAALTAKVPTVCENPLGSEALAPESVRQQGSLNPGPWQGGWQSILKHNNLSAYKPSCVSDPPTSTAPASTPPATQSSTPVASTPPSSSTPTSSASATTSTSPAAGAGSSGSSSTPTGLIAGLSAAVVLVLAAILLYIIRWRTRRGRPPTLGPPDLES